MYNRVRNLLLSLFILMSFISFNAKAGESPKTFNELVESVLKDHPASREEVWEPFYITSRLLSDTLSEGTVILSLSMSVNVLCDEGKIVVSSLEGLTYNGSMSWDIPINPHDTTVFPLTFHINTNDTGRVVFTLSCGPWKRDYIIFLSSDSLTVRLSGSDPRPRGRQRVVNKPKRGTPSEEFMEKYTGGGTEQYGVLDRDGYIHYEGTPEYDSIKQERERNRQPNPYIGDTTVIWVKDSAGVYQPMDKKDFESWDYQRKIDLQWEKIRKLEQSPLEKYDGERFMIGDEAWVRSRGETLFHKVEPVKDIFTDAMRVVDSLRALVPDTAIHISFDLRDPEQYKRVSKLVDSLIPMAKVGFYHGRIKRDSCGQLEKEGLKMGLFPRYPGEKRKYERPKKSKDESRSN